MQAAIISENASGYAKRLSPVGIGCSRVGSFNNPTPLSEIRATLNAALDLGVTVFDTANVYGQGDSEREVGRALRGRREEAFVVTKLGKVFSAKMRAIRIVKPFAKKVLSSGAAQQSISARRDGAIRQDFAPDRFAAAVEGSLKRLRFDYLDGLLLHSPPADVVRDPSIGEALCALQAAGKIRQFGVSCDDFACLEAALALPKLSLLQLALPVLDEAVARGLAAQFRAKGIAIFAREVILGQPELSPLEAVAAVCAREDVACVIVGASRQAHLQEIARACG